MMSSKQVTFSNANGITLSGVLELPETTPSAYALAAHCFTCTKDYKVIRSVARELAAAGIATLRFDFTGLGDSAGDFSSTTFNTNISDLLAAASWLEATHRAPALLLGHSFGGTAVLHAANSIASCNAVVTIAAVGDPASVTRHMQTQLDEIQLRGEAEVVLAGRTFTITREFLDSVAGLPWQQTIASLNKALLVCHSPVDETVSVGHATKIFQAAKHPKRFISLDNADHLFSTPGSAEYLGKIICAWIDKYI